MNLPLLRERLRAWYETHGRHGLPWRQTRDPYAIYVSEIMLQQTQVATVRDRYYGPFLERFPTLASLAAAPQEEVLKLWEGLGYYRRAKHLHEAAKRCGDALPQAVEALAALPGIGRNTAHAVASFAHGAPAPVMEANVRRVLRRLYGLREATDSLLWEKAHELLDAADSFTHNQAMMDLGSLVCTPSNPSCSGCPLAEGCAGRHDPSFYDAKPARKAVPVRQRLVLLVTDPEGRIYARPRQGNLLHGMYSFPELDAQAQQAEVEAARHALSASRALGHIRQTYSHFKLEAEVRHLKLSQSRPHWHTPEELARHPLSKADQKALALLASF